MARNFYYFKKCWKLLPQEKYAEEIPPHTRGLYVLYQESLKKGGPYYNAVYVGIANELKSGIRKRIYSHQRPKGKKKEKWSHFSAFEVHDRISAQKLKDLEKFILEIYSSDSRANKLNKKKHFSSLNKITTKSNSD
jgi:hypothetical protein